MESTSLNFSAGRGSISGIRYKINFSSNNDLDNSNNKNVIIYEFCKKQGYTKKKCYKLHDYDLWNNTLNYRTNIHNNGQQSRQNNNKNFRGRRIVANAHGTVPDTLASHEEECSQ